MAKLTLTSAVIWAAVIMAASSLSEPGAFKALLPVLGGGAVAHIIILGGSCRKDRGPKS